jgi:heme ABC exporter ATP-binding subunit CcmA
VTDHPPVVLEVDQLSVLYGESVALRGVSLSAIAGERVLLAGENGAGKSTLIRVLAGLQRPTRGRVRILDGSPYDAEIRCNVGVVVHSPWLDPDLTVYETLRFFGRLYGLDNLETRMSHVLETLSLTDRQAARISALSRGYQQRLTLARAILHQPRILLLDEPDTGLDLSALDLLARVIRDLAIDGGTVIMTSHNREFGASATDRLVELRHGRVVAGATEALSTATMAAAR